MLDNLLTYGQAAAALAGVTGLILCLGWLAPRTRVARPRDRTLVVKDTVALDARRRLHLVDCGTRQVLLLTGGERDVVVGWPDGPAS